MDHHIYARLFAKSYETLDEPIHDEDLPFVLYAQKEIVKKTIINLSGMGANELYALDYNSISKKMPEELSAHHKICTKTKTILLFPYLSSLFIETAFSVTPKLTEGLNLKSIFKEVAYELCLVPQEMLERTTKHSRVPFSWVNLTKKEYIQRILSSKNLLYIFGKHKINKMLGSPEMQTRLTIFHIWEDSIARHSIQINNVK
jgi:hypothetical protein